MSEYRFDECFVKGCEDPVLAHYLCRRHYQRWRTYGHPLWLEKANSRVSPTERFWRNVRKSDGCWQWVGVTNTFGYGRLNWNGKKCVMAHRVSWMIHNGEIPHGLYVLHSCDNPPCIRPDHLRLGTYKDNAIDREARGRGWQHRKRLATVDQLLERVT